MCKIMNNLFINVKIILYILIMVDRDLSRYRIMASYVLRYCLYCGLGRLK